MEMTLVKSLHSGDPDVICPVWQWMRAFFARTCKCWCFGSWQMHCCWCLAGAIRPTSWSSSCVFNVHVCSCNTCTGGAMSREFSTVVSKPVQPPNLRWKQSMTLTSVVSSGWKVGLTPLWQGFREILPPQPQHPRQVIFSFLITLFSEIFKKILFIALSLSKLVFIPLAEDWVRYQTEKCRSGGYYSAINNYRRLAQWRIVRYRHRQFQCWHRLRKPD